MKLSEYINYRTECPFCQNPLNTFFKAKRKQNIHYFDGRLMATLEMKGLNKGEKDYKVGYSFGLDDYSFHVEFLNAADKMYYEGVSVHLIQKFREFHSNTRPAWFTRNCTYPLCKRYFNGTKIIDLESTNFKSYPEIEMGFEDFFFTFPAEENHRIVVLSNKSFTVEDLNVKPFSRISFWRGDEKEARYDQPVPSSRREIEVPLIPFVSVEETGQRINTLLTFL